MATGTGRTALEFILRLNDQLTGPMGRVTRSVLGRARAMAAGVNRSMRTIRSGFMVATAGAVGIVGALVPAIAHIRAMGQVRSLGVAADAMAALHKESLRFSNQWGGSSTEIIRSAYDIQSAIAGLKGDELARFTGAANLAAKATMATSQEVTSFFGLMFNVFERQADAMGRARWVDMLTGQMAQTVKMFRTKGPLISAAFTGIGASAKIMGVSMAEQFAVMGTLQGAMPGAEAGTKYRSFLFGLAKAQKAFGISFEDSTGRLLSMPAILDKIRPKLAGLGPTAVTATLMKAFGRKEAVAVVTLLLDQTDKLRRSIETINRIRGLGPALEMAAEMVDPWMRIVSGAYNLSVVVGMQLLPVINPLIEGMAHGTRVLQDWAGRFPNLTKMIGVAALGLAGMALAGGLAMIAFGLLTLVLLPLQLLLAVLFSPVGLAIVAVIGVVLLLMKLWERLTIIGEALGAMAGKFALVLVESGKAFMRTWDKAITWIADKMRWLRDMVLGFLGPGTLLGGLLESIGIDVSGFAPAGGAASLTRLPRAEPLAGETRQAISNAANTDNSRRVSIGQVTITPKEEMGPEYLWRTLVSEGMA